MIFWCLMEETCNCVNGPLSVPTATLLDSFGHLVIVIHTYFGCVCSAWRLEMSVWLLYHTPGWKAGRVCVFVWGKCIFAFLHMVQLNVYCFFESYWRVVVLMKGIVFCPCNTKKRHFEECSGFSFAYNVSEWWIGSAMLRNDKYSTINIVQTSHVLHFKCSEDI